MEINSKYVRFLKTLGLKEKDISVYLYLLRVKKTTPRKISIDLNIPRSSVYNHIAKLQRMDLVREAFNKSKKIIVPEPPTNLFDQVDENEKIAKIAASLIKKNTINKRSHTNVCVDFGKGGFKRFFEEILLFRGDNKIKIFINFEELQGYSSNRYLNSYWGRCLQKGKSVKVLVQFKEKALLNDVLVKSKNLTRIQGIRVLDPRLDFSTSIIISGYTTYIVSAYQEGNIFVFESTGLSHTLSSFFDELWENSDLIL